jgi:hypothetical protein
MSTTAINLPVITDNTIAAAEHYARRYNYAGDMLRLYRRAFAAVKEGVEVCLHWNDRPMNLAAWRAEFMRALNARINGPQPLYRKLEPEWQIGIMRDRRRLADMANRIRVYQFETNEMYQRFGNRLARYDD